MAPWCWVDSVQPDSHDAVHLLVSDESDGVALHEVAGMGLERFGIDEGSIDLRVNRALAVCRGWRELSESRGATNGWGQISR